MSIEPQEAPLEGSEAAGLDVEQIDWLGVVSEAYKNSTTYLDANYRKQWEKNVSNFRSKHPSGSRYYSDGYKFRSKIFRPKIRAAGRRTEAAFAEALFSTNEIITLAPVDQTDKDEDKRAEVWQSILNHRLTNSIPWFLIAIGALQETRTYGVVVSRQDWVYEEKLNETTVFDPITQAETVQQQVEIVEDKPRIKLIEIENIRFDSGAEWTDPVNTSPYFIEIMPMYVADVLARMNQDETKTGAQVWTQLTRGEILASGRPIDLNSDSTRVAREGGKQDPKDTDTRTKDFEIVHVFRNFIQKDGQDYEFYSLTDKIILTEPAPPTSPLGRPYRIGISNIEVHRCIPSGDIELSQGIQAEINHVVNQRLDNVYLALNRGKYASRTGNIDLITMKKSYPGRIVLMDDPRANVVEEQVPDVTSSSYAEQDRLNNDMDDLTGGFSQGSVASNRNLNETVGGMNMLQQSGNAVQSYSIRTFCETWVEPVLRDIVKLIQAYESDEILAKFSQFANVQVQDRQSLLKDVTVSVSIGFGPLDPKVKTQATVQALEALGTIAPWFMNELDGEAVSREIFGPIGYRNGAKFFHSFPKGPAQQEDPMVAVKMQELQMRQQEVQMQMEIKQQELQMKGQLEQMKLSQQREIELLKMALQEGMTKEQLYSKLDLEMDRLNLDIMREMTRREEVKTHQEELLVRLETGSGV
jgi:hypothetical protein